MDTQFLGFSNDSDHHVFSGSPCPHGESWRSCSDERCREILRLSAEQRKELAQERKRREQARCALIMRGRKQSEYEIALDQARATEQDDHGITTITEDDESPAQPKIFRSVFRDETTVRAAVQFKVMTERQGELMKSYLKSDDGLPNYKRWDSIGREIGCSGKTVEREFRKLVEKFLKIKPATEERGNAIKAVRVRGERQPRYYRKRSIQFGVWRREWLELIVDREAIHDLRRIRVPIRRSRMTPIPSSPVNLLFAMLIQHFASELLKGKRVLTKATNGGDWEYNVRRAQRLLECRNTGPWAASEVYRTLGRGARVCGACRTFLIRGFLINGRKITGARQYCDNACKVRAERRKKRRTQGALENRVKSSFTTVQAMV